MVELRRSSSGNCDGDFNGREGQLPPGRDDILYGVVSIQREVALTGFQLRLQVGLACGARIAIPSRGLRLRYW